MAMIIFHQHLPDGTGDTGALTDYQQKRRKARRTLEGAGLYKQQRIH